MERTERRPLVAANWKMNGSQALCDKFAQALSAPTDLDVAIFPSALHLHYLRQRLPRETVHLGVQNVHFESHGAFTGEISAEMAAETGATMALVGHSERRTVFGETDVDVASKFSAAVRVGLAPILCVGEQIAERRRGQEYAVVERQIASVIDCGAADGLRQACIAYEPVWAIGTGESATAEQAQDMHEFIRSRLRELKAEIADSMRILYGGSVKPDNAQELSACSDIDGFLVGGASLDIESFNRICLAAAT